MTQKIAICAPSHNFVGLHLPNYGMYRQSKKNVLNSSMSSTRLHNMANFRPLMVEIRWRVWGTPANFNKCCVLPSLPQRCCRLLGWYTIYTFRGSCPITEFCQVQKSLFVQVLRSRIYSALLYGTPAKLCGVVGYKEWNYRTFAEGATYIRQGGHHDGHRPTF